MAQPKKESNPKKRPAKKVTQDIVVTENAIVISLSAADKRKALQCFKKHGKIIFSVKEHTVTKLPSLLENGKLID